MGVSQDVGTSARSQTAVQVIPVKGSQRCGHHESLRPAICGAPAIAMVGEVPYCSKHAAERIAAEARHDLLIVLTASDGD